MRGSPTPCSIGDLGQDAPRGDAVHSASRLGPAELSETPQCVELHCGQWIAKHLHQRVAGARRLDGGERDSDPERGRRARSPQPQESFHGGYVPHAGERLHYRGLAGAAFRA